MAHLEYDFADPNEAKLFPTHGWAINSQGVKLLWCPLNRLLSFPEEILRKKGSSQTLPPGTALDALPFSETLRKLATTLRELHQTVRISCDHPCTLEDLEALTADRRASEMVPLYVDLAFAYLRRIPDLLVVACRPLLFAHWQSTPRTFKEWMANVDRLASYNPSCNFSLLRETLVNHAAWFHELRDISPVTGKKGLRDALEHRGVRLLVGKQQSGDNRPRYTVMLDSRAQDVEIHKDILPHIPDSVAGLCRLMTGIHTAIGVGSQYEWGDFLSLVGTDDDIVGYWPPIQA
jgi:hypothetical protein